MRLCSATSSPSRSAALKITHADDVTFLLASAFSIYMYNEQYLPNIPKNDNMTAQTISVLHLMSVRTFCLPERTFFVSSAGV